MVATVVNDLLTHFERQKNVLVAYLYCNFNRQSEQSLNHLSSALVRQLFQEQTQLPKAVEDLYHKHRDSRKRPATYELKEVLHSLINGYDKTFIIVYALDELANADSVRDQLLDELFLFQGRPGNELNFLATTRFIPEVTERSSTHPQVEIRASHDDVERYLTGSMSRLASFVLRDIKLQDTIKRQVIDAADGMFLLARLQFDSLRDKTSSRKLQLALSKLKKGSDALQSAYDDALNRVDQQLDGFRELAYKVLMWITYARRQLTVGALQRAIAVEPGTDDLNHNTDIDSEHDIVSACAGLVVIDQESRIIRLVHYTTQEYVEKVRAQRLLGGQDEVVRSCLTYLSMKTLIEAKGEKGIDIKGMTAKYNFLRYLGEHWVHHTSNNNDLNIRDQISDLLLDQKQFVFLTQVSQLANDLPDWISYDFRKLDFASNFSALHVRALFSLRTYGHRTTPSRSARNRDKYKGRVRLYTTISSSY